MELTSHLLSPSYQRLKVLWLRFGIISLVLLAGGYLALHLAWETRFALRWLALTAPAIIYLVMVFRIGLAHNHRPGEESLLPSLGAGNLMTLTRGLFLAALVGFLFIPKPTGWLAWIPGLFYSLACAADFLDGYLARRTNHVTRLGEILDMSFDGVGVFAAATLTVQYGQAPTWYLIIAVARYLFLLGEWLRKKQGKPIYPLTPSVMRRVFAGLQMGFLAVILWPMMAPPASTFAATLFGIPFLVGFSLDWLAVSGVIKPDPRSNSGKKSFADRLVDDLPVLLRGAIFIILAWITFLQIQSPIVPAWLVVLQWIAALNVITGTAGRIFATGSLILLGISQIYVPLSGAQYLLTALYTGVLFLGSGKYSLWKPEDQAVYRQAGARVAHADEEPEA